MRLPFTSADFFARVLRWRFSRVAHEQAAPYATQERAYRRIRKQLAGTEVARLTGLAAAADLQTFARLVPARDYDFFKGLVERVVDGGERSVLFPGAPLFVGLSSGTSGISNKRIVLEHNMIKAFERWEFNLGAIIAAHSAVNPLVHNRLVWGATPPPTSRSARGIEQGYISGFLAAHRRPIMRKRTFPAESVGVISDMKQKLQAAARDLRGTPIHLASAVPSYLLNLLEELRAEWGVENFTRIWPQLSVILYSGTAIEPYQAQLIQLVGHPVQFLGMYLATEGPIGYEIPSLNGGVNGRFSFHLSDMVFTFRKLGGDDRVFTVAELAPGDEVELLLTAPSGLINYRIGDCLRIHSTRPLLFEITGRIGHGLNVATEKMTLGQLSRAAVQATAALPTPLRHFFVCPGTSAGGRPCYEWTLLVDHPERIDQSATIAALDRALMAVNGDYRENREELLFLDTPRLNLLDAAVARRYFERDAHRGQLKMKTAFDSKAKLQEFLRGLGAELQGE